MTNELKAIINKQENDLPYEYKAWTRDENYMEQIKKEGNEGQYKKPYVSIVIPLFERQKKELKECNKTCKNYSVITDRCGGEIKLNKKECKNCNLRIKL